MDSVLQVGALVDSSTPAAWVVKLLQDVEKHSSMQLTVAIDDSPIANPNIPSSPLDQLAHWLLNTLIDNPNFTHNPWKEQTINEQFNLASLQQTPDVLAHCDVIICLSRSHPGLRVPQPQVPVWSAALPLLDQGIQRSLVERMPFIWAHLWKLEFQSDGSHSLGERITSHSLPCQTYSISDLKRLTYSALPSVFMSRLVWLANSPKHKLDPLDVQNDQQGVFDNDIQLAKENAQFLEQLDQNKAENSIDSVTSVLSAIRLLVKKTVERVHNNLFVERWQMALLNSSNGETQALEDIAKLSVGSFENMAESSDVMWADPHLIKHQENTYLFFERMYADNKPAHIAYARLDENGQIGPVGKALTEKHHLSFPYVFTHEGDHYMIPETASVNQVSLYKATRFPDQWEHQHVLLDNMNAADSVLLQHEGLWWMFTCCQSHRSVDERDEMHLFYAEKLTGPWTAHPLNPVLTGVDRSRLAGPIVREGSTLYRNSQYGAWRYGYALNISRIDELTTTSYRETAVSRIQPDKDSQWVACHSLCQLGNFTVIDRARHSRR